MGVGAMNFARLSQSENSLSWRRCTIWYFATVLAQWFIRDKGGLIFDQLMRPLLVSLVAQTDLRLFSFSAN